MRGTLSSVWRVSFMNRTRIFTISLFMLTSTWISAQSDHIRIRLLVDIAPINQLTITGMGNSTDNFVANSGYGIAPGLEVFWILSPLLEAGVGFQWQIPRELRHNDDGTGESLSFIPVYATARINLTALNSFKPFFAVKLGYTFLVDNAGFQHILTSELGRPLISSSGGLYTAGALGVTYVLKDRQDWGLDFSMSVGYEFFTATANSSEKNYPIHAQAMAVDFALDFRF